MSFDSMEVSIDGARPYELYRFTMGAFSWAYTSAQTAKTFQGETYTPETISRSSLSVDDDVYSGQMTITIPLQHTLVSQFIGGLPTAPMWVTVWKQHEGLTDGEAQLVRKGRVLKLDHDEQAKMTIRPNLSSMRSKGPDPIYQNLCNWILYSSQCGASINWIPLVIDTYDPSDGSILFYADQSDPATDNLDSWSLANSFGYKHPTLMGGMLKHQTTGELVKVVKHAYQNLSGLNYLNLERPFVSTVTNGMTVLAAKGCDRIMNNCRFYGRLSSFMGFPRFRERNPFIDGVF